MARPYSMDLRERVVAAVERGGMSRHQAAARFGVAVSTTIRWVQRVRRTGSAAFRIPAAGPSRSCQPRVNGMQPRPPPTQLSL